MGGSSCKGICFKERCVVSSTSYCTVACSGCDATTSRPIYLSCLNGSAPPRAKVIGIFAQRPTLVLASYAVQDGGMVIHRSMSPSFNSFGGSPVDQDWSSPTIVKLTRVHRW